MWLQGANWTTLKSWLIHVLSRNYSSEDLRASLRNVTFASTAAASTSGTKRTSSHSHPVAARIRTEMNWAIDDIISSVDRRCYSVSMSAADERAGHAGNRMFYTAKDLAYPYRNDPLKVDDVIKMSDTGYYVDLPTYLDGHPVLLYEHVPYRAGGKCADGRYRIGSAGELRQEMIGGAKYEHAMWDFEHDNVYVRRWYGAYEYLIEKLSHPDFPQYRIIGLFPRRFIFNPVAWLISGPTLQRRNAVQGDWVVTRFLRADDGGAGQEYVSIAPVDSTVETFLPVEVLTNLLMAHDSGIKLDFGSVELMLERQSGLPEWKLWKSEMPNLAHCARLVTQFVNSNQSLKKFGDLTSLNVKTHSFTPTALKQDLVVYKPTMKSIVPDGREPLVSGSLCPTSGKPSENAAVEGRIRDVVNGKEPPRIYRHYVEEFVKLLVPEANKLVPTDVGELDERMPRPTQRAITKRALDWLDCQANVVKAFVKREAYQAANYPRVISTMPASHKTRYACYIYSLTDAIKQQKFYAFGKTPGMLEMAIGRVLSRAKWACATDFSKFDGTVSPFLRWFEQRVLTRAFARRFHPEVLKLHRMQVSMPLITRNGVRNQPGNHRGSGSPETTAMNTLENAFVSFCAFRLMAYSPEESFEALGLYGGDDGLSCDVDPKCLLRAATDLGLELKPVLCNRGDNIPFLGRIWYNAWTGDTASTCDFARQLTKLHLTTTTAMGFKDVLVAKALGFYHSDCDTPLVGDWARQVLRLAGVSSESIKDRMAELTGEAAELVGFHVRTGGTFKQPNRATATKACLSSLQIAEDKFSEIYHMIKSAKTLEDLFPRKCLLDLAKPVKIPVIVDGELRNPPRVVAQPSRG